MNLAEAKNLLGSLAKRLEPLSILGKNDGPDSPTWGTGFTGFLPEEGGALPLFDAPRIGKGAPVARSVLLWSSDRVGATNADVRCQVQMGVGGFTQTFMCDWSNGAQFSVVANSLRIDAVTWRPNTLIPYNVTGDQIKLGALCVLGTANSKHLTYTEPLVSQAAAAVTTYPVPRFAKGMRVQLDGNNDPTTATGVTFAWRWPGTPAQLITQDCQVFAQQPVYWPAPAGVDVLIITNGSGGALRHCVQWELAL